MKSRQVILPLLLVVEFACFLPWSGTRFDTFSNFTFGLWLYAQDVLVDAAPLLVLALGMTAVLITAGIDLSVGSMTALIACVMATFAGGPEFWTTAVPVGLLLGLGLGAFNGLLIARMDIPPIIASLGTLFFYRGMCYVVLPDGRTSSVFGKVPGYAWFGEFPGAVILSGAVLLLAGVTFNWSRWRRELLMLGGNRVAARYAGIRVDFRLFQVYALVGFCAFLAALMGTAREGAVTANWQEGLELQVIVSVVLGGTRVDGGFGSVWGSIVGVFLVVVLDEGLRMIGHSELQPVMLGLLLLLGVKLNTDLFADWIQKKPKAAVTAKKSDRSAAGP